MTDFTTECKWHCVTTESWSTQVEGSKGSYTVAWNNWGHKNRREYDYSCDCPSYKFGQGKPCKHIIKARGDHCNWSQFIDGGEATVVKGKHRCPECGNEVRSMGWAV